MEITPRFILFLVWFVGYVICFVLIMSFVPLEYTITEALTDNLTQLTGIFAPYIGPVVCYWFAKDIASKQDSNDQSTFVVALFCSAFFNLVIIAILASIFFRTAGEGKIEQTLSLMGKISTLLAFLVGPAIGFFFAKSDSAENRKAKANVGEPGT